MPAVGVVPADVPQDLVAGLVAGVEFEVTEFLDLEGCEEIFGRRDVPAGALLAHAADDPYCLQRLAILAADIAGWRGRCGGRTPLPAAAYQWPFAARRIPDGGRLAPTWPSRRRGGHAGR